MLCCLSSSLHCPSYKSAGSLSLPISSAPAPAPAVALITILDLFGLDLATTTGFIPSFPSSLPPSGHSPPCLASFLSTEAARLSYRSCRRWVPRPKVKQASLTKFTMMTSMNWPTMCLARRPTLPSQLNLFPQRQPRTQPPNPPSSSIKRTHYTSPLLEYQKHLGGPPPSSRFLLLRLSET